jgi:hypothetical protein
MHLTPEEIAVLEQAYEILAQHRLHNDFNQTHDFSIPDCLQVIDEVIDYSLTNS